jgi:hypothetical protein
MIVTADDELFSDGVLNLELLELMSFGFKERHYIQLTPPFEPDGTRNINRWLAGHSQGVRDEVELALHSSTEALALGPAPGPKIEIRVAPVAEATWNDSVPVLPLHVAVQFLRMPLRLLLENWRNDGNFLRAMAPPHLRRRFDECERKGWLERLQAGGLPEMIPRIKEDAQDSLRALRLWVLYDSDARRRFDPKEPQAVAPWGPSSVSIDVGKACEAANIHAHRLWRRAIENYLPARVLEAWAWKKAMRREIQQERARKVRAFLAMQNEQKHYFNMKEGIERDEKSSRGLSPLYGPAEQNNPLLRTGFPDLTSYLDPDEVQQAWLTDGQMDELLPVIESIFERM